MLFKRGSPTGFEAIRAVGIDAKVDRTVHLSCSRCHLLSLTCLLGFVTLVNIVIISLYCSLSLLLSLLSLSLAWVAVLLSLWLLPAIFVYLLAVFVTITRQLLSLLTLSLSLSLSSCCLFHNDSCQLSCCLSLSSSSSHPLLFAIFVTMILSVSLLSLSLAPLLLSSLSLSWTKEGHDEVMWHSGTGYKIL